MRWLAMLVGGRITKWFVAGAWIAILAVAAPYGGKLFEVTEDSFATFLPSGTESTRVLKLQESFPGGNLTQAAVIYQRESGITPEDRARAERDLRFLGDRYGADGSNQELTEAEDGRALVYRIPISLSGARDTGVLQTEVVEEIRDTVGFGGDGLDIKVGGPAGAVVDSVKIFDDLELTLVLVPVIVVALLLLLIYRSPFLLFIPLISVVVAYQVASASVYGLVEGPGLVLNSLGAGILGILCYGAGTDYALLLIARYREELRHHADRHLAMQKAVERSAPALIASAATVALGLLCLLAADSRSTQALGPVSAITVVAALLAVTTLLPALLVIVGRWVFWPFTPRPGAAERTTRGVWPRISALVAARPRRTWLVTSLVVALGWIFLAGLNTPQQTMFRTPPDSVHAQELIVAHFPAGASTPVDIVAPTGSAGSVVTTAEQVPGVSRIAEAGRAGDLTEFQAILDAAPNSDEEYDIIRQLRADLPPDALVGGRSAINLDLDETNTRDAMVLIPLVLLVILVVLAVLLRALLAPVLLILTVVLSFGAALGISVAIFEYLLGWSGQDASLPVLSFVFLVALGVDYNIFLVSRIREEADRIGTRAGAIRGLRVTGSVITSAGLVLAATFAVLAGLPVVNVAELGFTVALGILLDTLIVRSLLVPALIIDIGPRFWWPARTRWGRAPIRTTAPLVETSANP
jgi:RND superfamily putative drug exporter